jgi:lysophospholipase L1-like esterase
VWVNRYVGVLAAAAALVSGVIAVALFSQPSAHKAAAAARWVALGDSFSAGEGLPPFLPGTDVAGDRCHRSSRAYPALDGSSWSFACSGATTGDIASVTQRPAESSPQAEHPQLGQANFVTLTIGLNDIGYAGALMFCARTRACDQTPAFTRGISSALAALPAELADAYDAIRRQIRPSATVVVLGYPQLFPERPAAQRCPQLRAVFDPAEQNYLNRTVEQLDRIVARAASAAAFEYVSVLSVFRDHAPCEPHPYLNGITDPGRFGVHFGQGSFHPTAEGQRAYARLLRSFLRRIAGKRA